MRLRREWLSGGRGAASLGLSSGVQAEAGRRPPDQVPQKTMEGMR